MEGNIVPIYLTLENLIAYATAKSQPIVEILVLMIVAMNFNLGGAPSAPPKLKFIARLSNAEILRYTGVSMIH